ncbi:hypothetical protein Tco_0916161 [Tanacetum coccineum]
MGIRHSKPNALRGVPFDETSVEVINGLGVQTPPSYSLVTIQAWSCQILHNQWRHPSPNNTPLVNHASTLANPNPIISPPFLEANYEVLESLLRDHRRHVRNEDLRTELDYYSEEYDGEREMEPRLARVRKATPVLQTGSLHIQRHRGRVVEFEEALNKDGSKAEREFDGRRTSE